MDLLKQRENEGIAIFRAFAERNLKEHTENIKKHQRAVMATFNSTLWKDVKLSSNDVSIDMTFPRELRFIDMRHVFVKKLNKRMPKKYHDVYNRIIMGNYNGILMDLTYGITDAVIAEMKKNFVVK